LHPTSSQEQKLQEIFTIYNKVKRKGYALLFGKRDIFFSENTRAIKELDKEIHQKLMQACHNNPYVNSIRTDCKKKLVQQQT
jgi:DNA-binding FadR family transcriptional regulator